METFHSQTLPPEELQIDYTLHMAKNSYATYQLLLRNDKDFNIKEIKFSDCDHITFRYQFLEAIDYESESFYDPLSNEKSIAVSKDNTQSIWITAYADEQAETATLECGVTIITDRGNVETKLELVIYSVLLPTNDKAAFSHEYWMNTTNFWFRHPSKDQLDFIKHFYGYEKYSNEWWELNRKIAQNMKESRVNVLFVRTHDLLLDGGATMSVDGIYHFDWSLFDKWVDFFDEHAKIKLFAGYHLVVQTDGQDIYVIKPDENGELYIGEAKIGSPEAENWFNQFLPALYIHITQKGYKDRWFQHIEDEPSEAQSWIYAREFVRKHMPDIKCGDAIDNQEPMGELQNEMDLWIPRVDIYEKNREFYDYRMALGDTRWAYTCCVPTEQNYVNKMLGWPLLHNRVTFWGCFSNHYTGFLHWGYNFWDPSCEFFGLNKKTIIKGDGYIVYPDKENNSIKNSTRMIATRDSAQDYELLKLLADKNPKAAYQLAKEVIIRFNDFNWNIESFEKNRIELLKSI